MTADPTILYLVHDLNDAAVARRANLVSRQGRAACAMTASIR